MRFTFIAKHRGIWPVAWLCEALDVSRSGFHAWLNRSPSRRARDDEEIGNRVRASFLGSDRTYGARRVNQALQALMVSTPESRSATSSAATRFRCFARGTRTRWEITTPTCVRSTRSSPRSLEGRKPAFRTCALSLARAGVTEINKVGPWPGDGRGRKALRIAPDGLWISGRSTGRGVSSSIRRFRAKSPRP